MPLAALPAYLGRRLLLGVKLDDEVFLDGQIDIFALGHCLYGALQVLSIDGQPCGHNLASAFTQALEVLGFSKEEAYERFGFLLNAFKYGVPPHAGLAIGLDRFVMLLVGADNIREVIAFPKVKDASCLMTEAPGLVDDKQLDELQIALNLLQEEA